MSRNLKITVAIAVAAVLFALLAAISAHAKGPYPQCDTTTYPGAVCAVHAAGIKFQHPDAITGPIRCYYAGWRTVWDTHGRMFDTTSTRHRQYYPRWSCHTTRHRYAVIQQTGIVEWILNLRTGTRI